MSEQEPVQVTHADRSDWVPTDVAQCEICRSLVHIADDSWRLFNPPKPVSFASNRETRQMFREQDVYCTDCERFMWYELRGQL